MKALILTLGTRGDVQPFVALARGLHRAGHQAVLAAPRMFEGFVREHGVEFRALADGPMSLLADGSPVGDVADGGLRAKIALARRLPAMFTDVLRDCATIAADLAGVDVVVHNGQVIAGQHIAEKLVVPAVLALPLPMYVPTGEFPWPGQDLPHTLPRSLNRASFLGMRAPAMMFGRTVDRWRAELDLPRRSGRHDPLRRPDGSPAPVLHAVSPSVLPRPADWPVTATTTGYWFLESTETTAELPAALTEFLDEGEPPVFVGFGSMSGRDPAATATVVLDAAARLGTRVVLGTGWGGLATAATTKDVFVTGSVPFHVLLPRITAIVHHGGAGTIAAAAAAGRPQVICPFVGDQPFWGRRMAALGVAPAPIPHRRLTATALATALEQAIGSPALADAATALGTQVRAEEGVGNAVSALERVVSG